VEQVPGGEAPGVGAKAYVDEAGRPEHRRQLPPDVKVAAPDADLGQEKAVPGGMRQRSSTFTRTRHSCPRSNDAGGKPVPEAAPSTSRTRPPAGEHLPRQLEHPWRISQAHQFAARADALAEQVEDPQWPAALIDRPPGGPVSLPFLGRTTRDP
jgi:hypothetical protein